MDDFASGFQEETKDMITKRALQIVATILLTVGFVQAASAQWNRDRGGNRWDYLGEANVDGQRDHDVIQVGRADGTFRSLRIQVERAPIEFQRVVVHYANGESEELRIRDRIRAGGQTRVLNLRGRERAISSVEFWYAKANWQTQRPKVRLYGR